MLDVFISYRREDSIAYAGRLHDRLSAHFGNEHVFMDIDTIKPGEDFAEVLEQTVATCDVLIAVIGKQWLVAADKHGRRRLDLPEDFVRMEIRSALDRKIRVIPVLVQGASMPSSDELPQEISALARRHALELPDTGFHHVLGELIATVESISSVGKTVDAEAAKTRRAKTESEPTVITLPQSKIRRLFLWYKPPKVYGWVLRFYFHFCSLSFLVALSLLAAGPRANADVASSVILPSLLTALVLRSLTVRLERKFIAPL